MRARYEFDAPKSCHECELEYVKGPYDCWYTHCFVKGLGFANDRTEEFTERRAPFCPLEIIGD